MSLIERELLQKSDRRPSIAKRLELEYKHYSYMCVPNNSIDNGEVNSANSVFIQRMCACERLRACLPGCIFNLMIFQP